MNSSLTFKKALRILCLTVCFVFLILCLCSCGTKAIYRPDSMEWVSEGNVVTSTVFTYTEDNKPASVKVTHPLGYGEDYEDVYTYDERGNMTECSRITESMHRVTYTAKKITKYKYILYDNQGKEYSTVIFDQSGFIVSYRLTSGYVTEYAFECDENGKPFAFKQLDVRPSGSQRLIDYSVEFKSGDTFRMHAKGEFASENEYYQVKFQKITVKG